MKKKERHTKKVGIALKLIKYLKKTLNAIFDG